MLGKDYMLAIILVNCDGERSSCRTGAAGGREGRASIWAEGRGGLR